MEYCIVYIYFIVWYCMLLHGIVSPIHTQASFSRSHLWSKSSFCNISCFHHSGCDAHLRCRTNLNITHGRHFVTQEECLGILTKLIHLSDHAPIVRLRKFKSCQNHLQLHPWLPNYVLLTVRTEKSPTNLFNQLRQGGTQKGHFTM